MTACRERKSRSRRFRVIAWLDEPATKPLNRSLCGFCPATRNLLTIDIYIGRRFAGRFVFTAAHLLQVFHSSGALGVRVCISCAENICVCFHNLCEMSCENPVLIRVRRHSGWHKGVAIR